MVRHIRYTVAVVTILAISVAVTFIDRANAGDVGSEIGQEPQAVKKPSDPVARDLPLSVAKTYRALFPGAQVWQCSLRGKGKEATYELTIFYPNSGGVQGKRVDSAYVSSLLNYKLILNSTGGVILEGRHEISERVVPKAAKQAFDEWRRSFPKGPFNPTGLVGWYAYQAEGAQRLYFAQVVLNSVEVYEATLKADGTFVKKSTHFSKDRSPRPGETGTTRPAEAKRPEAPARKPSATVAALGERFVAAIASNDEKAYLSCWSTYEELMQFIENLPGAPKFTPEQMRENKEYQANVHKVAKKAFGEILANLRKAGLTPKTIKYHSVDASIRKKQGVEKVSSVDVYFTSPDKPGTIFYIWIDDAAKINGDWRFMDKPQSDIQVKP